jgi:hypothetical protein
MTLLCTTSSSSIRVLSEATRVSDCQKNAGKRVHFNTVAEITAYPWRTTYAAREAGRRYLLERASVFEVRSNFRIACHMAKGYSAAR